MSDRVEISGESVELTGDRTYMKDFVSMRHRALAVLGDMHEWASHADVHDRCYSVAHDEKLDANDLWQALLSLRHDRIVAERYADDGISTELNIADPSLRAAVETYAPQIRERSLVRCLIVDTETAQALILKRSERERFAAGTWELLQGGREPGDPGGPDHGETPDEAVRREIAEEIGLSAEDLDRLTGPKGRCVLSVISTDHFSIPHRTGHIEDWSNVNYILAGPGLAKIPITIDEDHDDHAWVAISDVKTQLGDSDYSAAGRAMIDDMLAAELRAKRLYLSLASINMRLGPGRYRH